MTYAIIFRIGIYFHKVLRNGNYSFTINQILLQHE